MSASIELPEVPAGYAATRDALQRVAAHVIARRRHDLVGKLGLRATPGGFGMPAAGPDHEVVRTSGVALVRETSGASARTTTLDLRAASLAEAAAFVDVELSTGFSVGHSTPELGDVDAPLAVAGDAAAVVAGWFALGWLVIDAVVQQLDVAAAPSVVQLWPEHFDAGCDIGVAAGDERRCNLGASAGDGTHAAPYLYVGPWGDERPGDPAYWNAPFGAVLGYDELHAAADPVGRGVAFVEEGLDRLRTWGR